MDWSYNENNIDKFVMNYKDMISYWKNLYNQNIYDIRYENLVNL